MIELKQVSKRIEDKVILDNITTNLGEGLSFITGPSGSGKSSLLRVIAGIDPDYQGELVVNNQVLSQLNSQEESYLLNQTIGFVWQDYKLLNELTVKENMLLPTYINKGKQPNAERIMADLGLTRLANHQVKDLSGGQRQRVAIARELMKNPDYILADEPTSALDKKTAVQVMTILRELTKSHNVIIVTHDTAHILPTDHVIELDKGAVQQVINEQEESNKRSSQLKRNKLLNLKGVKNILKTSIGRHKGRFLTAVMTLLVGTGLLLGATGENLKANNDKAFDDVLKTYGDQILDINLVRSFTGADGTGGDEVSGPSADVKQDIGSLYKKYQSDERIQFATYSQAFDEIDITVDGKNYTVPSSGNAPVINTILAGDMPKGSGNEVVVPESFVKKMGISNEDALGKEINFNSKIVVWDGETSNFKPTNTKAKIVGVVDTTMKMGTGADLFEYEIEDSFFFSEPALSKLLEVSDKKLNDSNFIIRTTSPKTLIEVRDELNSQGIVPLGNFEVVEDVVNLGDQSTEQTFMVNRLMMVLVAVMVAAVYLISSMLRRKEYATFKLNGFDSTNLTLLNIIEIVGEVLVAFVLLIILSPVLNIMSKAMFGNQMIALDSIVKGLMTVVVLGLIGLVISEVIIRKTTIMNAFKVGKE
ncbi:hypothetical protein BFC19_00845 [Brochothrix thermosphacta]|uniref:ABC transporter ATP-binding protein/permease n=1 Tax=Brochothrix thermosphacta TaxID=2756 RepID=UPI000E7228C2|nr:ATP-binding cassette domain-containing protein [Brochothrix thermosphacta]ANZ94078.1 hypothetical protein BFC19_00845 [Brochothrix thermosphacta]